MTRNNALQEKMSQKRLNNIRKYLGYSSTKTPKIESLQMYLVKHRNDILDKRKI